MPERRRYRSLVMDSARWEGFPFRDDDIVISTPPKCGTTWTQTLCAMLVLGTVELPRPLSEISPWLDMQTTAPAEVVARLEAQQHRRIVKTHTPPDGLPTADGVTFLFVGRDPRDVSLSWDGHWANLDLDAMVAARAAAVGLDDLAELGPPPPPPPDDPVERFWRWADAEPGHLGSTLAGVVDHLHQAWELQDRPGVALLHYGDLVADLPGQVRRLAGVLGVDVDEARVRAIADATTFAAMKREPERFVPDLAHGIWRSNGDFFREARVGGWRSLLDDEDLRRYRERVTSLCADPGFCSWLHGGSLGADLESV
jgi:hypothetical protein